MSCVVDASVAAQWFVRDVASHAAAALAQNEAELFAPDLILIEVANILWRRRRIGELGIIAMSDAQRLIEQAVAVSASPPLIGRAALIAGELDHPVYDCVYLALTEVTGLDLVTADRRLLRDVVGTPWAARVRALT